MSKIIRAVKNTPKKVGRPRTTGAGQQVVVRMHKPLLAEIDRWRAAQAGKVTRPEAIRRLVEERFNK